MNGSRVGLWWFYKDTLVSLWWVLIEFCMSFWTIVKKLQRGTGTKPKEKLKRIQTWKKPKKNSFPIDWFNPYLSHRLAVTTFISIVLPQTSTMSWDRIVTEVGTSKRPNLVFKENVFNNLMGDMLMQVPHRPQTGSNSDKRCTSAHS